MNFMAAVQARQLEGCHVCVGLDSEFGKIPKHLKVQGWSQAKVMITFNKAIIDELARAEAEGHKSICAVKLNVGPYSEQEGDDVAFRETVDYSHFKLPGVMVIGDGKRTDIGKSNVWYRNEMFGKFAVDAVTVNPYFGGESLEPFFADPDKGVIVLCCTSNKGAGEFQDMRVLVEDEQDIVTLGLNPDNAVAALYEVVAAHAVNRWNKRGNCALVAGATTPQRLARVRKIVGKTQLLIPGVGTQGADVKDTVEAGSDSDGVGIMVNSSSGIIFASAGEDFAEVAARKTLELNDAIKAIIASRAA